MAKLQRRFIVGAEYEIQGKAKLKRRVKIVGRAKIKGTEILVVQPVRRARKTKKRRKRN